MKSNIFVTFNSLVMFRKNKSDQKAKLEHKLYLARENPEPVFDLTDCGLKQVPSGIYSLCRVFLKESLLLDHNKLASLSNGGRLSDLSGLKVLNLEFNQFSVLPDDISVLSNLKELYLNNNQLKKLPSSLGSLRSLRILNVSNNSLQHLPNDIGDLSSLRTLIATGNPKLNHLPHSICRLHTTKLQLDSANFIYPPTEIIEMGIESIMKYICHDNGVTYEEPDSTSPDVEVRPLEDEGDYCQNSKLQEKIWEFDKLKQQKLQNILKFEKDYESYQRQELELQQALKENRKKFLTDITEQQNKLEEELFKIQQKKEEERVRLIKDLQDEEQKADIAITNLLISMREPLTQLIEHERLEEEKLLAAAAKYSDNLRRNDVLEAMRVLLHEETNRFKLYDENREEAARSILAQELMADSRLAEALQTQGEQQSLLVHQLQKDMELQRVAVGALLERGDARSWGLVQQVHLVEIQLAKLTAIEMDRRKLEMDEHLNDLAEKRANLSFLLVDLLEQQGVRRAQLLSTLQNMENLGHSQEDFWLLQYQQLLDRRPISLTDNQKNIDPEFAQELLLAGMIHYLPFLATWAQTATADTDLTEEELIDAGVKNSSDRSSILSAFYQYKKLRTDIKKAVPLIELEEPSSSIEATAPILEHSSSITATECVVCMDMECEIIFVPCGHMCCCVNCSMPLTDCPMCRGVIERKIKVLLP